MRTSVIIPTYNYGRFVHEAIDSVRNQTVTDLEIIVIDDGSTDDTSAVVRAIDEPRLRYIRTANGGISAARNEGLRQARGEFVAFLDADDRWRPEKLRLQLAMMESEPDLGAVFTNFVRFDADHVYPRDQFTFFPELARVPTASARAGHGRRVLSNAFETFVVFTEFPTWVQTLLFRASVLKGLQFPLSGVPERPGRYPITEDTYFCLSAYRRAPVGFIEEPLVEVRRHGNNVTHDLNVLPYARLAMLRLLDAENHTPSERKALRRRLGRGWVDVGRHQMTRGRLAESFVSLVHGLRYRGYQHAAVRSLLLFPFLAPVHWVLSKKG